MWDPNSAAIHLLSARSPLTKGSISRSKACPWVILVASQKLHCTIDALHSRLFKAKLQGFKVTRVGDKKYQACDPLGVLTGR